MRRIACICLLFFLLCGCQKSIGSFSEGDLDIAQFYTILQKEIKDENWKIASLNDDYWNKSKIEKEYKLDMTKVEESYVKGALMEAQFSEIAIFKVSEANEQVVKDAIKYRISQLRSHWALKIADGEDSLKNFKQGRIGEYYYFILCEDCKKVVNYIRSYE